MMWRGIERGWWGFRCWALRCTRWMWRDWNPRRPQYVEKVEWVRGTLTSEPVFTRQGVEMWDRSDTGRMG